MNPDKMSAAFLVGLLALAISEPRAAEAAPAGPTIPVPSADEAAIRLAGTSRDQAFHALKADEMAAVYADDAVFMPQTAKAAKGREAIRKSLANYLAKFKDGGYTPAIAGAVEVEVSGNIAWRSGTYSVTDRTGAVIDTGKWLETWRKSGDRWRLARDISNSDMLPLFPPEQPMAPTGPATSPPTGAGHT